MNSSLVNRARPVLWSALLFLLPVSAFAQADFENRAGTAVPGRITGRVVDTKTGAGVSDASIVIDGATIGGRSVIDGRFTVAGVPAGSVDLTVRRLGYAPKTITGIAVKSGQTVEQDIALDAATVTLSTTVVSASAERGTVTEALDRQRNANAIVNFVTAEQITKSGDGDAAQAVKRVSGVTLQSGRYVFVRGLGDRYTTASLDGARIPSPEPEKKVVPLDLFPSSLLETISTTKTFTPDQPGDFSGAQVDIKTREFPAAGIKSISSAFGYNSIATGKQITAAPRTGSEWLGFAGSARTLPSAIAAAGDFGSLSAQQLDAAARSFRDAWTPLVESGLPNYSLSGSIGGKTTIGSAIGYLLSGSYNGSQEIRADEVHSTAVADGAGGMRAYNQFRGSSSSNSVLWGGLANFSALVGEKTLVALNNTFNRSSDNEARQSRGTLDDYGFETLRSSLGFIERTVRSNQLRVQRTTAGGQELSATFTSSAVSRREPDRSELEYVREPDPQTGAPLPFALFSYNPEGARRTFSNLDESSLASSLDYRIPLGSLGDAATFRFGGAFRRTQRDADNSSYSILGYGLTRSQREAPAEQIFGARQDNSLPSKLTVLLNSTGGSYSANDRVSAGYGMIDLPIGERLKVIAGARVERADIAVRSFATTGERSNANLVNTDILPSLVANVSLTPAQSIRLSVSQTVSRPEYRELSPVTYRDVVAQQEIFGNPDLKRSLIRNFDARWEWFPGAGEILGLGFFAKNFANPIERVDVATSGASRVSFINADGAVNYGVEMELRKGIGSSNVGAVPLNVFTNATLMKSSIDISSDHLSSLTNRKRAMVGQAPYVVNAGLTWAAGSGKTTTTVLYNLVGRRITAAGSTPLPDTYETARGSLDLSFQTPLARGISARLDAKNLLDSPYETKQGPVVRESYRAGRVVSFGLKWQQ